MTNEIAGVAAPLGAGAAIELARSGGIPIPSDLAMSGQILVFIAVLLAIASSAASLWRACKPQPPLSEQVRRAVSESEARTRAILAESEARFRESLARLEHRYEVHEKQMHYLERSVAAVLERTRR